ncbi:MAG: CHAT domain-containing protein, partial [Acidobacteria bacterium]|nr:CHAT domain-containing protein [Acidobacteriota bacterium]
MTADRNLRKAARVSSNYFARLNNPVFDRVQRRLIKVLYDLWKKDGAEKADRERKLLFYAGAIKSRWLEDEIESMRGGVAFESPFGGAKAPAPENARPDRRWQDLAAALSSRHGMEVVLLDYIPVEMRDRILLFVSDRQDVKLLELPATWEKTTATVRELQSLLRKSLELYSDLRSSKRRDPALENDIAKLEAEILDRLTTLGSSLVPESVAARIRDKSVVVAPFGALHNVPFPALRVGGGGQPRYLIDHVARLANTPSVNALTLVLERYIKIAPDRVSKVLLAGNPKEPGLGAVEEFAAVRAAFPEAGDTSAGAGLRELMRSRSALHFVAHAFFDARNTARSGILLGDGILNLADIAMLELDKTRLVSMGSCETGQADVSRAGDEVWSLATAFMFAGVPAVVGYQWRLDSVSSREFYGRFYRGLAGGQNVGNSFRAAMLAVRGRPRNAAPPLLGNASPCYWAGFHLIGE